MSFKTNLHKQYITDEDKQENGVWYDVENGVSFKVRRISSKASIKARKESEAKYTVNLRNAKLSDDQMEEIALHQLAFGILSDWKGIMQDSKEKDEDGNFIQEEIVFSPETAKELLRDEDLAELRLELVQISFERDNFKNADDKEAVKN